MDDLLQALEKLPEPRKIEVTLFLLKSLGITEMGHRYMGSYFQSILFYRKATEENLFELVTMDKRKPNEQKEKEI